MTRHLRALGHRVTILTSALNGLAPDDAEQGIVRAWDLQASTQLRSMLRRAPLEAAANAKAGAPSDGTTPPRWMTHGLVPDSGVVTWLPSALRETRRILRRDRVDCIVTTGPPDSVSLLPLMLGRRRPPWIVDFRDGWRFEPLRDGWPTDCQDRLDARLEARVVRTAEVAVGVSPPIVDDLASRLGARAAWVPNAWDPCIEQTLSPDAAVDLDSKFFNLVYTGRLTGAGGRVIEGLLEALNRLELRGADAVGRKLRLVVLGGLDKREEALLAPLQQAGRVVAVGQVSRETAIMTQREADALLLLTAPGRASHATGKLYEYLAARRPVIALAEGSAAASIVRDARAGVVVSAADASAIYDVLARLEAEPLAYRPVERELDRYRFPGPAMEIAGLVEDAIAMAARGNRRDA
ncbi:MAG: glycosyltransferase [Solirubrobacteraceae bacterium]|nr:glycosyltransferase [Solirubrobacteraceae bacterium]